MKIADQKVVTIDYTLKDEDGNVIDTSEGKEPLAYIQGTGSIIPGLETALLGLEQGNSLDVSVAPDQAYGMRREDLVQEVPRSQFGGAENIEVGMQFQAEAGNGTQVVTVVGVDEENIRVDANHPLAGVTLDFAVTVVDVRDATETELEHGHVH